MCKIRLGVEGIRKPVAQRLHELRAPVLISANSLWNDKLKTWRNDWRQFATLDIALDSGGFTAMRKYGGYRFTPSQYAELVQEMRPTWWAQMDLCCEPQIASTPKIVRDRVVWTLDLLDELRAKFMENWFFKQQQLLN